METGNVKKLDAPQNIPGRTFTAGEFYQRLMKLNSRYRVLCRWENDQPAMLFNQGIEVCGVPKGFVPEFTRLDAAGHILARGWRDILNILLSRREVSWGAVHRVFRPRPLS